MKKLIAIALASVMTASAFCLPVSAYTGHVNEGEAPSFSGATSSNAFGDLLNWTGVVFGDVNNVIDFEGTLAVGGSVNSNTGLSVNGGAYGASPASTDDVALLVKENADIKGYGNVWGQTVIGNSEGNDYRLSNVTTSDTTNGEYTVADSSAYFADALSTARSAKSAVAALPANGTYEAAYGTYTFAGDPDAKTIVYNVDESVFGSYLFDFTIANGQTVVVNLTSPEKIILKNGGISVNGNSDADHLRNYNRNIIFNVVNSTEIDMTSCELYGILLAPDATLTGKGSNVCGTSILNSLTGSNGFELHVGYNETFVPSIGNDDPTPDEPENDDPAEELPTEGNIRIDVPRKMAVAFEDGSVYYGGEMKEVEFGKEYAFQMCSVNWDNGVYDENGNGLRGTVVYRMKVVHTEEFLEIAREAKSNLDRYTVKGIDVIDNEAKTIVINGDAEDAHLETDVNNFFMAYRFHFEGEDYNKKTGIDGVINTPLESLSVNLPLGSTISCKAFFGEDMVDTANVLITRNSGEGVYEDVYLTSVNDYTWDI